MVKIEHFRGNPERDSVSYYVINKIEGGALGPI